MKNYDSAKAVDACKKIDKEEMQNAKPVYKDDYYTELAYICSHIKSYPAALYFSQKVQHPEKIKDGELTYKTYQTITQTSLHLYYLHTDMDKWIDSVKLAIAKTNNLSDSLSNYNYLIQSYKYLGKTDSVTKYNKIVDSLNERFENKLEQSTAKNAFLEYQVQQSEREKLIASLEKKSIVNITIAITIIAGLSLLITLLIFLNRRKVAAKNRVLAELNKQLEEKADENELLLKEMHHRVKNNLSFIYSILDMQGRKTENDETREQLLITRNRIESIALTHEQIYKNQNGIVNMAYYIIQIINNCIQGTITEKQIVPIIDIDDKIILTTDKCLPIAMLINELITNTAKYAITDNDTIRILVKATMPNNTVELIYSDSGIPHFTNNTEEGFGSKIIRLLCKQLKATLNKHDNNKPYHYKIVFEAQ